MFGSVWSDLIVLHNYCVIIAECQKVTFLVDQQIFPWSSPSLLALVGVTIEKEEEDLVSPLKRGAGEIGEMQLLVQVRRK